jgi:hypothetical protein
VNTGLSHTPGPWTTSFAENGTVYAASLAEPHGENLIAYLPVNRRESANARLIAAAPQLLEAAQFALDNDSGLSDASCDLLRAAIEKAIA